MQLGIFARTFARATPLQVLQAARSAGFAGVQYNMACSGLGALPALIPPEAAAEIRAASAQTGVAILGLSATYNMVHPDPRQRQAGRESFAALAGAAQAMGTRLVTLCTGSRDPTDPWRHHPQNASPEAWACLLAEFETLIPLAETHDLVLGIEPELGNVIASAQKARAFLDQLQSPRLGIVLDPANLFEPPADPAPLVAEALDLLGDRLVMAHAKDRGRDGSVVAAGLGVIDFAGLVRDLRRAGFAGPLVTHGLTEAEAPAVARHLARVMA